MKKQLPGIATASAAIVALQGTAFAGPDGGASTNQVANIPLLGPETLTAVGATIATLGAYRLMRARKRADQSKDEAGEV